MEKHAPNIRRLAAFAATVRCGSVTAAANAIALTQPALTQAIARLEEQVGCKLFERNLPGCGPRSRRCCSLSGPSARWI